MKHIIEYVDVVNESFTYHLASTRGNSHSLGKRLSVQVSFMPKEPPKVKLVVAINGTREYEGLNLYDAVATYNTF